MKRTYNSRVNPERDYIKVGTCNRCKRQDTSVVVHHPPRGKRNYTICHFCSKETWLAVGEANKENYLKYGSVTKQTKRDARSDPKRDYRKDFKKERK